MLKNEREKALTDQMGDLRVTIPDELDMKFREAIFKSKGMKKGNLTEAVQEAIKMWILAQEKRREEHK